MGSGRVGLGEVRRDRLGEVGRDRVASGQYGSDDVGRVGLSGVGWSKK